MTRSAKRNLAGFFAGVIFGVGLAVSQLVNPLKVQAFLDIAGDWDPSLLLTMGSAVLVTIIFFRRVLRNAKPLWHLEVYWFEFRGTRYVIWSKSRPRIKHLCRFYK